MDNIIAFPRKSKRRRKNKKEIDQDLETLKLYHIETAISNIIPSLFTQIQIAGFEIPEDGSDFKDVIFMIESIKSIMCKYSEITHPFQNIANNIFVPDKDNEMSLAETININLKQNDLDICNKKE